MGADSPGLRLVTLTGNPKAGSRTLSAARALGDAVAAVLPAAGRTDIDVADIVDGLLAPWSLSPAAAAATAAVQAADVLVLATPTYKASFPGVLKLLLDTIPAGGLAGTVVLPLISYGGPAHRHLADWQLRPVLGELGAVPPVPSLLIQDSDFPTLDTQVSKHLDAHGALISAAVQAAAQRKAGS